MDVDDGLTPATGAISLARANEILTRLRPQIDQLVGMRADLAELQADMAATGSSAFGGLAEAKALEARLYATMEQITAEGVQVKGYAPLLLDWPELTNFVTVPSVEAKLSTLQRTATETLMGLLLLFTSIFQNSVW